MKKRLRKKRAKRALRASALAKARWERAYGLVALNQALLAQVRFDPSSITSAGLVRFDPFAPVKIEVFDRTEGPGYSTVSFRFLP